MRQSGDSRGRWWERWVHSCFVERKLTCCVPLGGIQFFRETKESCLHSLSNKICLNHSAKKIKNKMIVLTLNSNELICLSELLCAGIWQIVHRNLSTGEQNCITISANHLFFFFLFFYSQLSQLATARGLYMAQSVTRSRWLTSTSCVCAFYFSVFFKRQLAEVALCLRCDWKEADWWCNAQPDWKHFRLKLGKMEILELKSILDYHVGIKSVFFFLHLRSQIVSFWDRRVPASSV